MTKNVIRVVGARQHNLKNITVEIPRDKFVVINHRVTAVVTGRQGIYHFFS